MRRRIFACTLVCLLLVAGIGGTQVYSATKKFTTAERYLWYALYVGGCCSSVGDAADKNNAGKVIAKTAPFVLEDGTKTEYAKLFTNNSGSAAATYLISAKQGDVNLSEFKRLKASEQTRFVSYLLMILENEVRYFEANDKVAGKPVESNVQLTLESAKTVFLSATDDLGLSASVLAAVLKSTSPNFLGANSAMSPIISMFNVFLGVLAILLLAFFFLTLLLDLSYINIPGVRTFINGTEGSEGHIIIGRFVSKEAVYAVQKVEQATDGYYFTAWEYIKTKWVSIVVLLILLVALVSGRIMQLASSIINLVSGFY